MSLSRSTIDPQNRLDAAKSCEVAGSRVAFGRGGMSVTRDADPGRVSPWGHQKEASAASGRGGASKAEGAHPRLIHGSASLCVLRGAIAAQARHPRGYAELRFMAVLGVVFAVAIATIPIAGHVLSDRDRARADLAAAEAREDRCLEEWGKTVARASLLRAEIQEHLAIESEAPCACWVPDTDGAR